MNNLLAALKSAIAGLTYESESDEPFSTFQWSKSDVGNTLTSKTVLDFGHHATDESVEEQTFSSFFAPLTQDKEWHRDTERNNVRRYRTLADTLRAGLSELRVFIVGATERSIYVIGKTSEGNWLGIKTKSIQT